MISRDNIEIIEEDNVVYDFDGLENYNSTNLLGILAISVVFGSILSILNEEGKPIVQLATCLFKVMMKMVDLFIWYVLL
jgi:Na+/H+-dicarboxylate symporter